MNLLRRLSTSKYPRLALLVALGGALLLLGVVLALAPRSLGSGLGVLGFRVGLLGILLLVFGGSGYVAISVFEGRPDP